MLRNEASSTSIIETQHYKANRPWLGELRCFLPQHDKTDQCAFFGNTSVLFSEALSVGLVKCTKIRQKAPFCHAEERSILHFNYRDRTFQIASSYHAELRSILTFEHRNATTQRRPHLHRSSFKYNKIPFERQSNKVRQKMRNHTNIAIR